jgi:hypothetical protein
VDAYVPPGRKKAAPPPTLTAAEISSEQLFPTLGAMQTGAAGASWSQIRNRLNRTAVSTNPFAVLEEAETASPSPPTALSFTERIKIQLEREKKQRDDGIRQDQVTDPKLMTNTQLVENGWAVLSLNMPNGWAEKPEPEEVVQTGWSDRTLMEEFLDSPYFKKEEEKVEEIYASASSEERARKRLHAFVGSRG